MSAEKLEAVCANILALRDHRRHVYEDIDRYEAVLCAHMAEQKLTKFVFNEITFKRVPRKIIGTPSQRRKWRALVPPWALDAWHQPERIEIKYPEREAA